MASLILDVCVGAFLVILVLLLVLEGLCMWDRRSGDGWRVLGLWLMTLAALSVTLFARWLFRV